LLTLFSKLENLLVNLVVGFFVVGLFDKLLLQLSLFVGLSLDRKSPDKKFIVNHRSSLKVSIRKVPIL
jgi:hypothetical protein